MKKLNLVTIAAIIFCLTLFSNLTNAQTWVGVPALTNTGTGVGLGTGINELYVNPTNTFVGIGTSSLSGNYRLTVKGESKKGLYASGTSYAGYFAGNLGITGNIRGLENTGIFGVYANTNDTNGSYFKLYGKNHNTRPGQISMSAHGQGKIEFYSRITAGWIKHMTINPTGKITIGTDNTPTTIGVGAADISAYRLFVKGGILTDELRVRTGWADYVFEKDYQLKSLSEVEAHIDEMGYLHNTPSAEEVETEGIEIGEITKNQQEKIEEVFLHLIAMEKRIDQLEAENTELKKALEEQK